MSQVSHLAPGYSLGSGEVNDGGYSPDDMQAAIAASLSARAGAAAAARGELIDPVKEASIKYEHHEEADVIRTNVQRMFESLTTEKPSISAALEHQKEHFLSQLPSKKYKNTWEAVNDFLDRKIPPIDIIESFARLTTTPPSLSDILSNPEDSIGWNNLDDELKSGHPVRFDIRMSPAEGGLINCGNTCYLISLIHYMRTCVYFALYSSKTTTTTYNIISAPSGFDRKHISRFFKENIHCQFFQPLFEASRRNEKTTVRDLTQSLYEFITSAIQVVGTNVTVTKRPLNDDVWGPWQVNGSQKQNEAVEAFEFLMENLVKLGYSFENSVRGIKYVTNIYSFFNPKENRKNETCVATVRRTYESCFVSPFRVQPGLINYGEDDESSKKTYDLDRIAWIRFEVTDISLNLTVDDRTLQKGCSVKAVVVKPIIVPTFIHLPLQRYGLEALPIFSPHPNDKDLIYIYGYKYRVCELLCHSGRVDRETTSGHYIHCGLRRKSDGSEVWNIYDDHSVTEVRDGELLEAINGFIPISIILCLVDAYDDLVTNPDMGKFNSLMRDCPPPSHVAATRPTFDSRRLSPSVTAELSPVRAVPGIPGEFSSTALPIFSSSPSPTFKPDQELVIQNGMYGSVKKGLVFKSVKIEKVRVVGVEGDNVTVEVIEPANVKDKQITVTAQKLRENMQSS